jgi:hypothetical protein
MVLTLLITVAVAGTLIPTATAEPSGYQVFLPIVSREALPDLVVESLSLQPSKNIFVAGEPVVIRVVIANRGESRSAPAWVDLYINPAVAPGRVNTRWNDVCAMQPCFGLAWAVPSLAPSEQITLTSEVGNYAAGYSVWPGWFAAGTQDLYVFVDSWNATTTTGAVRESNENNNILHLPGLTVQGQNPPAPARLNDARLREARPQP